MVERFPWISGNSIAAWWMCFCAVSAAQTD